MSNQNYELFDASEIGDLQKVRQLLESGADKNAKNEYGRTALHRASYWGKVNVVAFLIEKGANIEAQDNDGGTPLHSASYNGKENVVKLLLEHDANIEAQNNGGWTPLHWASLNGKENVVKLLLEKGANPNITNKKGQTPLQLAQQYRNTNCVRAIELFLQRQQEEKQRLEKEQFKKKCLEKFPTRTQLDKELQRLQELIKKAEKSLDPTVNKNAEQAQKEYDTLLSRCDWPEYTKVSELEKLYQEKEAAALKLKVGSRERSGATQELAELKQRLDQEYKAGASSSLASTIEKPRFFQHLDALAKLVKEAKEDEAITIVPILEKACNDMTDFLQLKIFFTAVNAQFRLGTITTDDRNSLILASLNKAPMWCTTTSHVACYRVALRYAMAERIITEVEKYEFEERATVSNIQNADFIKAMSDAIKQNTARIDRMENAVAESISSLQQNLKLMADAINAVQANTEAIANNVNELRSSMAHKRKVEAACSLVSAVLNAVSMGAAGSALQGVLGFTLAHIADFGDLDEICSVLSAIPISPEMKEALGDFSIEDMLNQGISLAEEHADDKLDKALSEKNAIVVIAASAKVFATNLTKFDDDPTKLDKQASGIRGASVATPKWPFPFQVHSEEPEEPEEPVLLLLAVLVVLVAVILVYFRSDVFHFS